MIADKNKGIDYIEYDHLNLPTVILFDSQENNGRIRYTYDATGIKLKKIVEDNTNPGSSIVKENHYDGGFIYEQYDNQNPELKFFAHAEGYLEPTVTSSGVEMSYVYQYKDHLGNIRLSYKDNNGNLEIVEENNYYPFGLTHKGYNGDVSSTVSYLYGFNGKEENDELGIKWLDFGARNYDASLGRWMNIDPMAENGRGLSPYNFAFNNPINFIDSDGRWPNCPPGVNCGFATGLTFVFGTSTSLRANVTASVSVANNYQQMNFDFSFGVYLFGQGTSSRVGNLQYDLTASGIATGGFGQGRNLPIYTLNSYTRSAFGNDFMYSLSYGQMFNYNSASGKITRIGHFGARAGNIGLNSTNDYNGFPYFGGGTDRFWTGGITFSTRQNSSLYEIGYESFTGDYSSNTHIKNGKEYYRQTTNDLSLNRASTFIRTRGVALDFMKSGWLQDLIHNGKDESHYFDYFSDIENYNDEYNYSEGHFSSGRSADFNFDFNFDFDFDFDFGSPAPGSFFGQGGFLDDTWDWITGNGPGQCPGGC